MDSHTFDTLTRRFVSRRAGAGLALAGLLGMAVPGADAKKKKKKKKCKKPCGLCQTCKKGKCANLPGLKQCGAACIANTTCCTGGAQGCPDGGQCTGGTCTGCKAQGAPCDDPQTCCTGVCGLNHKCTCLPMGQGCLHDRWCCGGNCVEGSGGGDKTCGCGNAGTLCNNHVDCCSNTCSVGVCQ